ncbi:50S ribosomal protein L10 [Bacteriovoracaceae bacterium]|nr:50S ribosomal protein L10 [Bacteriovoracaceae bacterium]
MLTRSEKDQIINDLRDKIDKSEGIFLTNVVGISANESVELRKQIREKNGALVVTKNKLFGVAAKGTKAEEVLSNLKGTNAVAFAYDDAPGVAKAINDSAKELEAVELKAGLLEDRVLDAAELVSLANLPSKEQMLATLLATFNAPVSAFVRTVEAIRAKKEEEEGAA